MPYTFDQKIELEQLRALESLPKSTLSEPLSSTAQSYEEWLLLRLSTFKQSPECVEILHKPRALFNQFLLGFVVFVGLLGLLSASGLMAAEQQQVNVFWLLGSLIGANGVTLILWLVFVVVLRGRNAGLIASIMEWPLRYLYRAKSNSTAQQVSSLAWWQAHFGPDLQKWRFSGLAHVAWLCFLCGSLLGLALVFTTEQYDFIWESTLISQARFQTLITALGAPLGFLFLPTAPISVADLTSEQQRQQWALFIFSCVLLYAIVPRILALVITHVIMRLQQRRWQLDLSHDYYIGLRSQFNTIQYRSRVVDEDPHPPQPVHCALSFSPAKIPEDIPWYGLEVDPNRPWRSFFPQLQHLINEADKVADLQAHFQHGDTDFVVFVEGQRLPDRGLIRSLRGFSAKHLWLAITTDIELSENQKNAWLKLILKCQLNDQKCVLVKLNEN